MVKFSWVKSVAAIAILWVGGCRTPDVVYDADKPSAVIMNNAETRNGRIVIAPAPAADGECAWRLAPGNSILSGKFILPELTVYGDPKAFSLQIAKDNEPAVRLSLTVEAGKTYRNLTFTLPETVIGATVLTLDITGTRPKKGDLPAIVMAEPRFYLDTMPVADAQTRLRFCHLNPWHDPDAAQPAATEEQPENLLTLSGPRNDWLTGAVMLKTDVPQEIGRAHV